MERASASVRQRPWGRLADGGATLFTLTAADGTVARISDLGAALVGLELDVGGDRRDVVLGLDRPATGADHGDGAYFGAVIGRVANRIALGRFELGGRTVQLETNDGPHHLHGGRHGFHRRMWSARALPDAVAPGLALTCLSADGEGGYPGEVAVTAVYGLAPGPTLRLELGAVTDRVTPVSLTHHPYLNLAGHASGSVLGHRLQVAADRYLPTTADGIPLGEEREVDGTAYDFRTARALGRDLPGEGYDVHLVVRGRPGELRFAARLTAPASDLALELWTTQPGLQLYTGNGLDGTAKGKGGAVYRRHGGVALEAQAPPDAVHGPGAASVLVAPGVAARHVIEYRFSVAAAGGWR